MRIFGYDIQFSPGFSQTEQRSAESLTSDLTNPTDWMLQSILGMAQSATGITVTPLRAMGVAAVFACVRVVADAISTLPLEVKQRDGRSSRVALEHPLYNVLRLSPNDEMTSADWRWAVQSNLCLSGVGYSEIIRDMAGRATGVKPILSGTVYIFRDPLTRKLVYQVTDDGWGTVGNVKLKSRDILHLRGNTFNGITGLNTTACVRECIALALALQDNAAKFFGNGSRPGGVLEHPMKLSADAQKRLADQFEEKTGGANLYRMMVLEEGMKYNGTRSENTDSQFLESKDAQNLEVCRVFGVPPHKIGITGGQPRANIEEENIGFVTDLVRPGCVRWEMEMDTKLFTPNEQAAGYFARFDIDAMLRGNMKARADAQGVFRQWGIMSQNDCRVREGLPTVEGGDVLLQPTNMIDSSKATEFLMLSKTAPSASEGGTGGKPNANTK